jgi:hypothetical protein
VLVGGGQVGGSAGLLVEASVLQAQSACSLLADVAVAAAERAGALRVVAVPPPARPAGPVVSWVDAPAQAALAGVDVLGAAGMASAAESLAEVVALDAAGMTRRWAERSAGQAVVAEVDAGTGPSDSIELAAIALGRQPKGAVRSGLGHDLTNVLAGEGSYTGRRERGFPSRGATTGRPDPLPLPPSSLPLAVSDVRRRER